MYNDHRRFLKADKEMMAMKKVSLQFIGSLIAVILMVAPLAGCNLPAPEQTTPDLLATSAAQTVAAHLTQPVTETLAPPVSTLEPTQPPTQTTEAQVSPTTSLTPTGGPEEPGCNKIEFVTDVTIADDTSITPGSTFTKTWRLRNDGTCTWTTGYKLVFVDGDKMGGADELSLLANVAPQSTIDLSVDLTAPEANGTYRGNWKLRSEKGTVFGLGEEADVSFWVQIVVTEITDDLGLGDPTWRDTFTAGTNWFLVDTDNTVFEIKDGNLVMVSKTTEMDEWGLSNRPKLTDFYLEIIATTGEECSGLDRYGVLVRAPDAAKGYVFGFSCAGSYRLYLWDGENYTGLQEWASSPHILSGPNQTNRMGIMAEGSSFKLYANGKLLTEVSDSTYAEGRFGLFIGSKNTVNFTVAVEEAAYWLLD
jgi:hypothetical protein